MHKSPVLFGVALLATAMTLTGGSALAQNGTLAATATSAAAQAELAGNAVLAVGTVTDTAADGSVRQLHDGDAITSGDRITTGDDSYADLNFEDGGRMLLRPDTDFEIQQYHYNPAVHDYALAPSAEPRYYTQTAPQPAASMQSATASQPVAASPTSAPAQQEHESAFFRLIKGGFRAISGFIGHVEHQDYTVETPVATIGIRGTGYEVRYCDSGCPSGEKGLYTGVGRGAISVRNQAGESVTTAGHFGYIQNRTSLFRRLQHAPRALQHMQLPARYRARDARNFRRIRMQRRQRWGKMAARRGHKIQNPRGIRSVKPKHPPRYGAVHRAADGKLVDAHHPKGRKKRTRHPPHHHDGRGRV